MQRPPRHSPTQHHAKPSPKLSAFLAETLAHVRAGQIGRETAKDAIKAWPAIHTADHGAKAAALRELACTSTSP